MSEIERVKSKVVVSGNIVEVYTYSEGYLQGFTSSNTGRTVETSSDREKYRQITLKRAQTDLRRLINANVFLYGERIRPKFVTFTFADDIQDLDTAHNYWEKFVKRFNYQVFQTKKSILKYSVVVEFTKKGRIHYHAVFYNVNYIKADKLAEIWGNGFVKITAIDDVSNIGAYICKYMSKDHADERLIGRKCYFNSRGLYKPTEYINKNADTFAECLPEEKITYQSTFENEHLGVITYKQYKLCI